MKLRLHAGSLRLRLSQSEITRLHEVGEVQDAVVFAPGRELGYSIATDSVKEPIATFDDAKIRVVLPEPLAMRWMESDQTGIEALSGGLKLLIEKDFQCLHRAPEPGEDSFPNPLAE